VLNNGKNVSMAQSWGRNTAVVRHLTRLSMSGGERQVRGWPPPRGGEDRPWRLILSLQVELVARCGWLLEFLPGMGGGGLAKGCWIAV